jgi:ATP-dependent RNA helicase RhlE
MTFKELHIVEPILRALEEEGYTHPTPIQEQSIPILLRGKDLLGCAQTGTGKTAAFAIPILQHLYLDKRNSQGARKIHALVVAPTRELAIQIGDSFTAYGRHTGIKNTVVFGGVKQGAQTKALGRGIDVLVATPGRLLDLMQQGYISLSDVKYSVLDEADRMLDMGFIHDIRRIINKLPAQRQSLFFSATMSAEIVALSTKILGSHPEKVAVQPEQTTAEKVEQGIYFVSKKDKRELLVHILKTENVDSALVFSRTKHGANKIVKILLRAGIEAEAIHGNKSQGARQRALSNFKGGTTQVLVATDIAARGIDVEDLSHVINYDLPNIPETYVHRIGRTGRARASGVALSFCDGEERAFLRDIQKLIGQKIPVVEDHPYPDDGTVEKTESEPRQQRSQRRRPYHGGQGGGNSGRGKRRRPQSRQSR